MTGKPFAGGERLDRIVADNQRRREERARSYREQALRLFPWVCARCGRSFEARNLRQLTVHHRDDDHHNNPPDGSNWELLCIICHEAEHTRNLDAPLIAGGRPAQAPEQAATHRPFAGLARLVGREEHD